MRRKFLPLLEVASVLESAVLYARDISDAPTAILSSGMVSCSSSSFNILTFQTPYMFASAKLMSSALVSGKCKGEFTPRWLKREKNKMKPCCVPGCSVSNEHTCGFTSFETVYIACDVSVRLLSQRVSCYVASIIVLSLIPRLSCVGREKRAWYTLFAHPQLSQDFWEFGNFP